MTSMEQGRRVMLNQRLVKDRDQARARELRRVAWICAGLLVPVLFYLWQQVEFIRYGYRVESLRAEKARLTEWNRQLRLERATLQDLKRIEHLAALRLGLVPPSKENTIKVRLTGDTAGSETLAQQRSTTGGLMAAPR